MLVREYLDSSVMPLLTKALDELAKQKYIFDNSCRPENPIEFVAHYLLKNNPNKKSKLTCEDVDTRWTHAPEIVRHLPPLM